MENLASKTDNSSNALMKVQTKYIHAQLKIHVFLYKTSETSTNLPINNDRGLLKNPDTEVASVVGLCAALITALGIISLGMIINLIRPNIMVLTSSPFLWEWDTRLCVRLRQRSNFNRGLDLEDYRHSHRDL